MGDKKRVEGGGWGRRDWAGWGRGGGGGEGAAVLSISSHQSGEGTYRERETYPKQTGHTPLF